AHRRRERQRAGIGIRIRLLRLRQLGKEIGQTAEEGDAARGRVGDRAQRAVVAYRGGGLHLIGLVVRNCRDVQRRGGDVVGGRVGAGGEGGAAERGVGLRAVKPDRGGDARQAVVGRGGAGGGREAVSVVRGHAHRRGMHRARQRGAGIRAGFAHRRGG